MRLLSCSQNECVVAVFFCGGYGPIGTLVPSGTQKTTDNFFNGQKEDYRNRTKFYALKASFQPIYV